MRKIWLNEYQYEELCEGRLFINKYDMSLKTLCEMNRYWKEFAYDLICELCRTDNLNILHYSYLDLQKFNIELLTFIKNNYKLLIKDYNLKIDFRDYIELNDYILFKDWIDNENHFVEMDIDNIFIWSEN